MPDRSQLVALHRLATRQYGIVGLVQLRQLDLDLDDVRELVRSRRLERLRDAVYRAPGAPPSREQAVLAAVLAGGECVAAGLTAAWLWGLRMPGRLPDSEAIEVLARHGRYVRRRGVVGHRTTAFYEDDLTTHRRIPVTTVARTLVDLSGRLSVPELGGAVDDALRRRILRLDDLRAGAERLWPAPGRRIKVVQAVLSRRLPGYDPGESALENRVFRALARAGLPLPTRQHRVQIQGKRYRLDGYFPDHGVALEIDSFEWHGGHTAFHRDRLRDVELLAGLGIPTVRVTDEMDDATIVRSVAAALDRFGSDRAS